MTMWNICLLYTSRCVEETAIRLILPQVFLCLREGAHAVVLVKPQFEAGRAKVGKNGVVRDKQTHCEVLVGAAKFAVQTGFHLLHIDYSPITGPKGNIEFLLVLEKPQGEDGRADVELSTAVEKTVEEAHSGLKYV